MRWYTRISPARLLTATDWRYITTQFFPVGMREYVLLIEGSPKLWYATEFCMKLLAGEYVIEGERSVHVSHVFACELLRGIAALLYAEGPRRKVFVRRSSADGGLDLSLFKVYAARRGLCYGAVSRCLPAPRTWRGIIETLQSVYPFFVTIPV